MPKTVSEELINSLQGNNLYPAIVASGLLKRCHNLSRGKLESYAKSIISKSNNRTSTELLTAANAILLKGNKVLFKDIRSLVIENDEWWSRSVLTLEIDINQYGEPSYEAIMNNLLRDDSADVSVIAVELIANKSLGITLPLDQVNPIAQLSLKSVGIIGARRGGICPVSNAMQHILGLSVKDIDWKKLLGKFYVGVAKKASRLKGYSETDATSWVNLLDTIHDNLLESLFTHEAGALGTYSKFGSLLSSPTSRFAIKYPQAYKAFKLIHDKRYVSAFSHAKSYKTGRTTQFIEYSFIGNSKKQLRLGYLEIFRKW